MVKNRVSEAIGDTVPQAEPLAYGIIESCRRDGTGRSTKYKAINPDPQKRDGLPFLPSFNVGRRRLILAADHQEWLEKLRNASLAADLLEELESAGAKSAAAWCPGCRCGIAQLTTAGLSALAQRPAGLAFSKVGAHDERADPGHR
jgi:hypothetical protein